MSTVLRPYLFMNAQSSAGTYGLLTTDFRFDQDRLRSISGVRAATDDVIKVLLETVVPQFSLTGDVLTPVVVTATATVFTSANGPKNSVVLQGPFTRIKLQKVGTGGTATFVGIL